VTTVTDDALLAEEFEQQRPHLHSVAYRMLGSTGEADDAVQEAWLRLSRSDSDQVENLRAWLTTVVGRVSLDMLRARKARRESPDDHLEPIVTAITEENPAEEAELADTVGLDVCASVGKEVGEYLGLEIPDGFDALIAEGKKGKKTGEGLYKWENGKPVKPEVDPNYKAPDDITERMILPMLNESVACLHDGVVDDADLLDAGVIFGTGFAPFRGGPIAHIRSEGADKVKAQLDVLAGKYGARFAPKAGWDSAALRPA